MFHDHPPGQSSSVDALVREGPDGSQNRLPDGLLPQDGVDVAHKDGVAQDPPIGPEALEESTYNGYRLTGWAGTGKR